MAHERKVDVPGKAPKPPSPERRHTRKHDDKQDKNTDDPSHQLDSLALQQPTNFGHYAMNSNITDFLTFNCRKIAVRSFVLDCRIGAYEHEKHQAQRVVFECDVWVPLLNSTSLSDDLHDVLNYDQIVSTISEIALSAHFNLQETLVDAIADKLIALPNVQQLRVSTAKLEPYKGVAAVGIEVWRRCSSLSYNHEQRQP
jgi:dihydroneopterin aldolase